MGKLKDELDQSIPLHDLAYIDGIIGALAPDELKVIEVEPVIALKYKGDFNGLLEHFGLNKEIFYLTALLNRIDSPLAFDGKMKKLITVQPDIATDIVTYNVEYVNFLERAAKKKIYLDKE